MLLRTAVLVGYRVFLRPNSWKGEDTGHFAREPARGIECSKIRCFKNMGRRLDGSADATRLLATGALGEPL